MKPRSFMLIAGEPSGDLLAAELVQALRGELTRQEACPANDLQPLRTSLAPRLFGAGGPRMAEAGVELVLDLTQHAVVGLFEVLKKLGKFRSLLRQLRDLAFERQPDVIILVDFSGFNRRFAHAVRRRLRAQRGRFNNWQPRLVQFVSPQVWASRESRVRSMAQDLDLLLSIFPFEKDWYALRAPNLRVEFVGHPMLDRYTTAEDRTRKTERGTELTGLAGEGSVQETPSSAFHSPALPPLVLLLPGSRPGELSRHLPAMIGAARRLRLTRPLEFRMVLPNSSLAEQARHLAAALPEIDIQVGDLAENLRRADLAIASTGTVTMECAYFGVPTVALYRTSWGTYQIGKRLVRVAFLAMPNLLAGESVFPELIQDAATEENIAREALALLNDTARREWIRKRLARIIATLGGPGAARRAAHAVAGLLNDQAPLWK
jgi:lipid-A-disaccharide synthase